jgi:hypothetical protein
MVGWTTFGITMSFIVICEIIIKFLLFILDFVYKDSNFGYRFRSIHGSIDCDA